MATKTPRPTDYQRSKVYGAEGVAEARVIVKYRAKYLTRAEATALVRKYAPGVSVRFTMSRGAKYQEAGTILSVTRSIHLPKTTTVSPFAVLHEVAHARAGMEARHSGAFVAEYLRLVGEVLGEGPLGTLVQAFIEAGVHITAEATKARTAKVAATRKPRPKKAPAPTERQGFIVAWQSQLTPGRFSFQTRGGRYTTARRKVRFFLTRESAERAKMGSDIILPRLLLRGEQRHRS